MASDKAIIKQVLAGKRDAFGHLVQRYEALVQGAVRQRVRCADEAEDLVQEVFCKAYQKLPRLRDLDRFGPWLGRMAANMALDWVRHRRFAAAPTTIERIAEMYIAGGRPDVALEDEEARLSLWAALDRLAPELRKVVVLHHIEGCTQREIAHFLGIALPTLRWRLYRARAKLDEELRPLLREDMGGKTSVRERVLALLSLGPLWRPVFRTAGIWQRWLALGGAGLGVLAVFGGGDPPLGDKVEPIPAYSQYKPRSLPDFSVSWTPTKPRRGERVRLEVAGLAAEPGAVLHYIVHPSFPRDRTLPLRREGEVWVAELTVPVGAETVFFYPAAASESSPDFVGAISPLQRQKMFERYSQHFSLVDQRGVPVRGAGYARAQMAREQGRPYGEVLAYLRQEIRRYPDHFAAYALRWWTLSKQGLIEGREGGEVMAKISAEQEGLRRRFPQRLPTYVERPFVAGSPEPGGGGNWVRVDLLSFAVQLDDRAQTGLGHLVQQQANDPFLGIEQQAEDLVCLATVAEGWDHREAAVAAYTQVAALAGSAVAIEALERLGQPASVAPPAENFRLPTAGGEQVELTAYRGQAMLLAYGGLGGLMPGVLDSLEILQQKYGVEVLCVDGGYGERGTGIGGEGEYGFTFARDDGQVFSAYRPNLLGSLFLIDGQGRMRLRRDLSRSAGRPVLVGVEDCFLPIERRLDTWQTSGELSG